MNEKKWKWVERGVYLFTFVTMIVFYMVDEAKEKAVTETNLTNILSDVEEINKKLYRYETYWINQNQINGRVVAYIDLDSK